MLAAALGAVVLAFPGVAAGAPPANDNFADATALSGASGTQAGDSSHATKESGEPNHAGNSGGHSIWYAWTAPADGAVTIDTIGSSFDTLLAVYTGTSVTNLTQKAANDDIDTPGHNYQSRLSFTATAGTTYHIAIDGYGGANGTSTLNWTQSSGPPPPPPPGTANDNFADATALSGASGTQAGDSSHATKESGEPNHAGNSGGHSIWYAWTAPADGAVTIDTIGSSFDTLLAVYTGTSVTNLTQKAANDDIDTPGHNYQSRLSFTATAGTTYHIAIDGYGGANGTSTLNWTQSSAPPPPPPPGTANDNFADATALSGASGTQAGDSSHATKESGEPNHAGNSGGHSIWYAWTAPADGAVTIDTIGSSFDTLLAVYTGTSVTNLTQKAANDDIDTPGHNYQSRLSFTATAGTTYHIAIDGYGGANGTSTLNWTQSSGPPPPPPPGTANDNFADATALSGASGTQAGDSSHATKESGEPNHAGNSGGHSIWYAWTAPADGAVTIDTIGSSFDTLLAVYTGTSVTNLTQKAANDDIDTPGHNYQSRLSFTATAGTTYHIAIDGYGGANGTSTLNWTQSSAPPPPPGAKILAAAGDIACASGAPSDASHCQHSATAQLIVDRAPDVVAALGDQQYENATYDEFMGPGAFDDTWGRFKAKIHPTPGNHEYGTAGAAGYFQYFGAAAGDSRGYYSYDVGSWHVVSLTSNCTTNTSCSELDAGAAPPAEVSWLNADLDANAGRCLLAYWHHPLFSDGNSGTAASPKVKPLWDALYAHGADVVLNGHAHSYERFAPRRPDGADDPAGIREFVVGTGGDDLLPFKGGANHSQFRDNAHFGVIFLALTDTGYSWNWRQAGTGASLDSGSGQCHSPASAG